MRLEMALGRICESSQKPATAGDDGKYGLDGEIKIRIPLVRRGPEDTIRPLEREVFPGLEDLLKLVAGNERMKGFTAKPNVKIPPLRVVASSDGNRDLNVFTWRRAEVKGTPTFTIDKDGGGYMEIKLRVILTDPDVLHFREWLGVPMRFSLEPTGEAVGKRRKRAEVDPRQTTLEEQIDRKKKADGEVVDAELVEKDEPLTRPLLTEDDMPELVNNLREAEAGLQAAHPGAKVSVSLNGGPEHVISDNRPAAEKAKDAEEGLDDKARAVLEVLRLSGAAMGKRALEREAGVVFRTVVKRLDVLVAAGLVEETTDEAGAPVFRAVEIGGAP